MLNIELGEGEDGNEIIIGNSNSPTAPHESDAYYDQPQMAQDYENYGAHHNGYPQPDELAWHNLQHPDDTHWEDQDHYQQHGPSSSLSQHDYF